MIKLKPLAGILFSVSFIALMAANDGKAQTSTSGSNANSNSQSSSGSSSSAQSNSGSNRTNVNTGVTLNQNSTIPANTTTNGVFSTSNSGFTSSDVTIRSAPQVYAPPVSGGNPCTLAVSGGVSVIGWGASAGGTYVDQDCANRQKIAMIHNAGYKLAAKELMCNEHVTYDAFKTAGEPCAYRQQFEGNLPPAPPARPAPYVQYQPSPVNMTIPPAPQNYPRCSASITDNCQSGR